MAELVLDYILLAIIRAASYITIAIGFALVFGTGRVLNLSHGMFFLLGAYSADWFASIPGIGGQVLVVYTLAITFAAGVGGAFYFLILRLHVRDRNRTMLLCLAANLAVAELLRAVSGAQAIHVPTLLSGTTTLWGVNVARQQLLVVPVALAVLAGVSLVVHRTRAGRAVRAVAQDRDAARLCGLLADRVIGGTFVASCGLAALAACILTPLTVVGPDSWVSPLVKSFAVVVLGGARRLHGLIAASMVLAVAETSTAVWLSEGAAEFVSLVIIVLVLVIRPRGVFGKETS